MRSCDDRIASEAMMIPGDTVSNSFLRGRYMTQSDYVNEARRRLALADTLGNMLCQRQGDREQLVAAREAHLQHAMANALLAYTEAITARQQQQ